MNNEITTAEKIAEVKREIRMRHSVYPKLVRGGKLTEIDAARQILILEAIQKDYEVWLMSEPFRLG